MITAVRTGPYNSPLGSSAEVIRTRAEGKDGDVVCVTWGVGNHGGGPSRKDLADIAAMQDSVKPPRSNLHSLA